MHKVTCEDLKVPYPHQDHSKIWAERVDAIYEWAEKYTFGHEIKELFYEFLRHGFCITVDQSRVYKVVEVLHDNGFAYEYEGFER
jgi:hypothetical protein